MTSPTAIESFSVEVFEAPLKRPFVTALGRKDSTVNVGLSLRLRGGDRGYGEASSSLALAHLSPARLRAALERLGRGSVGRDAAGWAPLCARAWELAGPALPAAAAFECALLCALAASRGLSLADWFGAALRQGETDLTLSAADPASAREAAAAARAEGFRILKIKVGTSPKQDLARIRAARQAHPKARVILDGNQGLTVASAMRLLEACAKLGLTPELLEQPLPKTDLKGMAALVRRCRIPVAADESATSPREALELLSRGAASAFNVKAAKSGLTRSLAIVEIARAAGVPLMMGCMAESARGLSASVHFALGTGAFRWLDLDSDHLLAAGGKGAGFTRRGPIVSLA